MRIGRAFRDSVRVAFSVCAETILRIDVRDDAHRQFNASLINHFRALHATDSMSLVFHFTELPGACTTGVHAFIRNASYTQHMGCRHNRDPPIL